MRKTAIREVTDTFHLVLSNVQLRDLNNFRNNIGLLHVVPISDIGNTLQLALTNWNYYVTCFL